MICLEHSLLISTFNPLTITLPRLVQDRLARPNLSTKLTRLHYISNHLLLTRFEPTNHLYNIHLHSLAHTTLNNKTLHLHPPHTKPQKSKHLTSILAWTSFRHFTQHLDYTLISLRICLLLLSLAISNHKKTLTSSLQLHRL